MEFISVEQSRAELIDRRMREGWRKRGGTDMAQRAREKALDILNNHKPEPPLPPMVKEELREIFSGRKKGKTS